LGFSLRVLSGVRHLRSLRCYSSGQQGILLFLALLISGLMVLKFHETPVSTVAAGPPGEVVVEISGEVDRPGIHFFRTSPTLREALARAGGGEGPRGVEDGSHPELLRTGTLLTVARSPEGTLQVRTERMEARKLLVFFIPLDLNRVTVEDLCLIPGVGESLARDIVAYRERRKGFHTVTELKRVRGIGEAKWKALHAYLTIQ
jgi:competence protein ComEA